jgi:hypothetical protein
MIGVELIAQKTIPSQPQQRPDSQIAEDINTRLTASNQLCSLGLSVWVHDGTATLSGTVPNVDLRQQADTLVRAVPGIKTVDEQIAVGTASTNATPSPPGQEQEEDQYNQAPPGDTRNGPPPPPPQEAYQNPAPDTMVTVAPGTPITVMMLRGVDSKHTLPGTGFRGVLVRDVILQNGIIAIPRGAYVQGTVIDSRPPGHLKGHPRLALQLSNLEIAGAHYPLTSYAWARRGPGKGGQTAANVTGSAAVGAVAGGIVGGGPTALLGAALGGLGGAGLTALSPGARLIVPAESVITFYLNAPVTVREPTINEIHSLDGNVPAVGPYASQPYYPGYPPSPPPPPVPNEPPVRIPILSRGPIPG